MLCKKPFMKGTLAFGCGQCMPCRITRRRIWTHRMMLEALKASDSCFITLTYSDEYLPSNGSLVPDDAHYFIDRLRKRIVYWSEFNGIEPVRIRYFLVGEYGDQNNRPHYHAAIFGIGREFSNAIAAAWGKGFTYTGDLTKDSASYIAGYVTKKMTKKDDPRLGGRFPEFARMSNRPGIGALAIDDIKKLLTTTVASVYLKENNDVPLSLNHGSRSMPLGRYLRSKLRVALGLEKNAPPETLSKISSEVSVMLQNALLDKEAKTYAMNFSQIMASLMAPKVASSECRAKIFAQYRSL